jgi:hypothetical protein
VAEPDRGDREGLSRRQILLAAGGAAAVAVASGGVAEVLSGGHHQPKRLHSQLPRISSSTAKPMGRRRSFQSRPDLRPPTVTASAGATSELGARSDPGFLFLGPGPVSLKGSEQYGPLVVDRSGGLVWFRPVPQGMQVTNVARSSYRGEPVLVWWEGNVLPSGYGQGEAVLVDRSYREVTRIRAAHGRHMDMHALTLTAAGTALFTCYPETVQQDLASIGGSSDAQVLGSIIQEVDIATGRLLFEWRALQHIPVASSYEPFGQTYDYLHTNSIQELPDGNLLVSARHTWALYKLERRTGQIIWTLGGKQSEFQVARDARFAWQHDAHQSSERVLTLFDNDTDGTVRPGLQSRGLVLELDESRRRVSLRHAYPNPQGLLAGAMGSMQMLPSGRVMVGWGVLSRTTEFTADGTRLIDFALPAGMYSYHGSWLPWTGTPHEQPAVAAGRDPRSGAALAYASWNGATNVASWLVEAGSRHDRLQPLGIARHQGFETIIPLHPQLRFASVTALDGDGRRLRRSAVVKLWGARLDRHRDW